MDAKTAKPIRQKMSRATIKGFKCGECTTETVTYDGSTPAVCQNCNAPNPVRAWENLVITHTTVEVIN